MSYYAAVKKYADNNEHISRTSEAKHLSLGYQP